MTIFLVMKNPCWVAVSMQVIPIFSLRQRIGEPSATPTEPYVSVGTFPRMIESELQIGVGPLDRNSTRPTS